MVAETNKQTDRQTDKERETEREEREFLYNKGHTTYIHVHVHVPISTVDGGWERTDGEEIEIAALGRSTLADGREKVSLNGSREMGSEVCGR